MEEKQTIIAMGSGGSTKVYYPKNNDVKRVYNVKDVNSYIEKIDEMINRKMELFKYVK